MDGVLTDYERAKSEYKGKEEDIWHQKEYWMNMKWMPDGEKLWNIIKKYNPIVLSSPGRMTNYEVIKGKDKWVNEELGKDTKRLFEVDKAKYAKDNHILIDDKESNIDEWVKEGGIGILHKNAQNTLAQLKEKIK